MQLKNDSHHSIITCCALFLLQTYLVQQIKPFNDVWVFYGDFVNPAFKAYGLTMTISTVYIQEGTKPLRTVALEVALCDDVDVTVDDDDAMVDNDNAMVNNHIHCSLVPRPLAWK